MAEKRQVAIIHFNTPELTEAAIKSLRKHGGEDYQVTVFDNSDERPFTAKLRGVTVIDNTRGQIIDFEAELAKYPDREDSIGVFGKCVYGSAKHMMTVQKLWELIPQGFVLMESDVLIKANIDTLWDEEWASVGHNQLHQPQNPFGLGRVCPMLCYMNVPLLTKHGAKYFDPTRTYGLLKGRDNKNNWYDTGAVMFEDIVRTKPALKGKHVDITKLVEHYSSGSWRRNDIDTQKAWLNQHRQLWETTDEPMTVAVCAIGRLENRYVREWIDHYKHLGVDKIYIYDNNHEGEERFADVLQAEIADGLVDVTLWENNQKTAYEDCYNRHNREHRWIGFFDFDELVEIQDGRTVHDLLSGFDFADVLVMNWRTMTDNGLVHYEDKPVKERFTEGTGEDLAINGHVKSWVQTGIEGISFNDPHCPNAPKLLVVNVHGVRVEQKPIQPQVIHDIARVDHYNTKTAEEWLEKVQRGWCDANATAIKQRKQHAVDYFFNINKRTEEKDVVLGVSKPKTTKRTNRKGK